MYPQCLFGDSTLAGGGVSMPIYTFSMTSPQAGLNLEGSRADVVFHERTCIAEMRCLLRNYRKRFEPEIEVGPFATTNTFFFYW